MITYLTSNLKNYYKENDIKYPKELDNTNGIISLLENDIKNYNGVLSIASDPSDFEKIDYYSDLMKESLKLSGLKEFKNYNTLDNRNISDAKKLIEESSLIILSGGHTFTQKKFFDRLNLKDLLKDYDGVVLGISAGTVNMAHNVYNSPECEEDLNDDVFYDGLGLTSINAEPHFELNIDNTDNNLVIQRNHVLKESYNRPIIGLPDGSFIRNDILYGLGYLIEDGNIKQICEDKNQLML